MRLFKILILCTLYIYAEVKINFNADFNQRGIMEMFNHDLFMTVDDRRVKVNSFMDFSLWFKKKKFQYTLSPQYDFDRYSFKFNELDQNYLNIVEIKKLLHLGDGSLNTTQKIDRAYQKIRKNSYKLKQKKYNIQALSPSAQGAILYRDAQNQMVMAKMVFVLPASKVIYRLYFNENHLFFANVTYQKKSNRFYFRDGELIEWLDSRNHTIQDQKLLEAKAKEIMQMVDYLYNL